MFFAAQLFLKKIKMISAVSGEIKNMRKNGSWIRESQDYKYFFLKVPSAMSHGVKKKACGGGSAYCIFSFWTILK